MTEVRRGHRFGASLDDRLVVHIGFAKLGLWKGLGTIIWPYYLAIALRP
jgi:hypothetical protein